MPMISQQSDRPGQPGDAATMATPRQVAVSGQSPRPAAQAAAARPTIKNGAVAG